MKFQTLILAVSSSAALFAESMALGLPLVSNELARDADGLAPEFNADHPKRIRRGISQEYNADVHTAYYGECTVDLYMDASEEEIEQFLTMYQDYIVKVRPDNMIDMDIPETATELIIDIRRHAAVEAFEHGVEIELEAIENKPDFNLLRIQNKKLPDKGELEKDFKGTGKGVYVYVIDSGVSDHQEFGDRIDRELGRDFTKNNDSSDCGGHGTHVAGTIAGETVGVATEAIIVPYRIFGCSGSASGRIVMDALEAALADVRKYPDRTIIINESIGGSSPGQNPSSKRIERLMIENGAAVARSAGNSNAKACDYNHNDFEGLSVGATDERDQVASFSNYGECVDILAPGTRIVSARNDDPTGYSVKAGTSMAAPAVAGALAVFAEFYDLKGAALQEALLKAATRGELKIQKPETINSMLYVAPAGTQRPPAGGLRETRNMYADPDSVYDSEYSDDAEPCVTKCENSSTCKAVLFYQGACYYYESVGDLYEFPGALFYM